MKRMILMSVFLMMACVSMNTLAADHEVKKSFNVKNGGLLEVEADIGSIEVKTHSVSKVDVTVQFEKKHGDKADVMKTLEEFDLDIDQRGKDVVIRFERKNKGGFSWNNNRRLRVHFEIVVPREYHVDLNTAGGSISVEDLNGNVNSNTSGGSLKFGHIEGNVNGKTSGGSIQLESCNGEVDVKTSGGSIQIGRVKGNVEANTSGGGIEVEEVFGNIDAKTSGGHIECTLTRQPTADCYLKTSGGSIQIYLKDDIAVNLNARTSGGKVRTDFPVVMQGEINGHRLKTEINGGGPELSAHSFQPIGHLFS